MDPSGQWMVSGTLCSLAQLKRSYCTVCVFFNQYFPPGGDDKTLRFWEVATSRCLKTLEFENGIQSVSWNPNICLSLLAIVV